MERYVVVDKQGLEADCEYDTMQEAIAVAQPYGYAVIERHYEYTDSELVWTPNGEATWPTA